MKISNNPANRPISLADADRGKRHVFGYDLVRAVAIVMVVLDHSLRWEMSGEVRESLRALFSCDALLFFMLSGALLLPVEGSWKAFYRRRALRVYLPMVIWSIIYALLSMALLGTPVRVGCENIAFSFIKFYPGSTWFISVICSIYLFMPMISPWIARATRKQLELFLLIWLASGVVVWINHGVGLDQERNIFYMFATYLGYTVAGYYFSRYPLNADCNGYVYSTPRSALSRAVQWLSDRRNALIIVAGIALGVILPASVVFFPGESMFVDTFVATDFSLSVLVYTSLVFLLLSRVTTLGRYSDRVVGFIATYSFGIFIMHDFMSAFVIRYIPSALESTPISMVITLALSIASAWVVGQIPYVGKFMIVRR